MEYIEGTTTILGFAAAAEYIYWLELCAYFFAKKFPSINWVVLEIGFLILENPLAISIKLTNLK